MKNVDNPDLERINFDKKLGRNLTALVVLLLLTTITSVYATAEQYNLRNTSESVSEDRNAETH